MGKTLAKISESYEPLVRHMAHEFFFVFFVIFLLEGNAEHTYLGSKMVEIPSLRPFSNMWKVKVQSKRP